MILLTNINIREMSRSEVAQSFGNSKLKVSLAQMLLFSVRNTGVRADFFTPRTWTFEDN